MTIKKTDSLRSIPGSQKLTLTLISIILVAFFTINGISGISAATTATTFNVSAYGAVADGKTDSTAAIMAAIAAAKASDAPSIVQFGSGSYLVDRALSTPADQRKDYALIIDGLKNCTLQGSTSATAPTTILVNNPSIGGIVITNSANVSFKNLNFDYVTVPYTQGTIFSADAAAGKIVIDLDPGYADFSHPMFNSATYNSTFGMAVSINKDKSLSKFGIDEIVANSFSRISENRWQINVADASKSSITSAGLKPGTRYVQEINRWEIAAIYARHNKDIEVRDVTVYASPCFATDWVDNEGVTIHGLHTEIKPSTNRMLSSNSSEIQSYGNRKGFLIENCSFYGTSDDSISLSGKAGYVWEVIADNKIKVNTADTFYRVGDVVQIMDTVKGVIRATVKITAVEVNDIYITTLTFDKAVAGIVVNTKDLNLTDTIFNYSACDQNSIIKNNVFYSHRGRHIVLRTHDCTVQGNDFRLTDSIFGGMSLEYSQFWGGGPAPENILIKNNTFTGIGTPHQVIAIGLDSGTTATGPDAPVVKNITIEGNKFNNMLYISMWISGANNLLLKNNIINVSTLRVPGPSIFIQKSSEINIDGLTGLDPNTISKTSAVIQLTETNKSGAKGNHASNIIYTLPATGVSKPQLIIDASKTLIVTIPVPSIASSAVGSKPPVSSGTSSAIISIPFPSITAVNSATNPFNELPFISGVFPGGFNSQSSVYSYGESSNEIISVIPDENKPRSPLAPLLFIGIAIVVLTGPIMYLNRKIRRRPKIRKINIQ
ncbi:MAG: glycosyl hydrolase family 28-related protein [Saccharofermentanales bacterium]